MPVGVKSRWIGLGLLALALAITGCTSTGHLNIFGYTTEPNYDPSIQTIYVPIAQNQTLRRGLEFYLTEAVIREIGSKTPFRIVSCREAADTELNLKIATWRKNMIITTQTNQVRQAEIGLGVEVVWKDLRPGKIGEVLSSPKATLPQEPPLPGVVQLPVAKAPPVLLLPVATYETELGGSNAAAEKQAIDRVAVQIVSMMEKSW
jgi:hypothetical protein